MKILGHTAIPKRTRKVLVGYTPDGVALEFTLKPCSFGAMLRLEEHIPAPVAPSTGEVKRDPKTKQVLKRGGAPIVMRDETDPAYLQQVELREMAIAVGIVLESVGDQIEVRDQLAAEAPQDYYLALLDEMHEAGLDLGMFTKLSAASKALARPLSNAELAVMQKALGTRHPDAVDPPEPPPGADSDP